MFESLEQRRMLACAVNVTGGVLTVNGDKQANVINVIEVGGNVHVETSSLPSGAITSQDFTGITRININGGAGDDTIYYDGDTVGATIHGDNNTSGGSGGHGNDQITVTDDGSASSIVYGDKGDDTINVIVANNTSVIGGQGKDKIYLNQGLDPSDSVHGNSVVDAGDGDDTITTYGGTNAINGGKGKDTVLNFGGTNTYLNVESIV
jgi:hypothetical protein